MKLLKKIILIVLISIIIGIMVCIPILNKIYALPIIYNRNGYYFEIPVPNGVVHSRMGGTCVFTYDYLKTKDSVDRFYEKEMEYAVENYIHCGENAGYNIYFHADKHILLPTEYTLVKHRLVFTRLRINFAIDADEDELVAFTSGCNH